MSEENDLHKQSAEQIMYGTDSSSSNDRISATESRTQGVHANFDRLYGGLLDSLQRLADNAEAIRKVLCSTTYVVDASKIDLAAIGKDAEGRGLDDLVWRPQEFPSWKDETEMRLNALERLTTEQRKRIARLEASVFPVKKIQGLRVPDTALDVLKALKEEGRESKNMYKFNTARIALEDLLQLDEQLKAMTPRRG